ncbi:MAG: sporulation protein YqfD [Firmicutes bacterium]|nr:sporulation protein YqfD [Bacillota bacterium]
MKGRSKELKSYTHQVKITIEGFKINRLISKAIEANIGLRHLTYISDTKVQCYILDADLNRLQKLAKSTYKVTIVSNTGTAFHVKKYLSNPYKIVFTLLTVILVISQSFFVKTIEITGFKGIPETEIRDCLKDVGIREGSYIPNIDWEKAEERIYDVFPEITWLRLVYDGRKVFLEISEGEGEETETFDQIYGNVQKEKYYCNIVASQSGYIDKINTYRGVALVQEGDFVEKGQVLILGCVPIKEKYYVEDADTEYFVKSEGKIWAKVPYRLTFEQELYDKNGKVRGKQKIKEKANQQVRKWSKENLPENAEILNKDLNFSYKDNTIEVGMTIEILQQIGEEQEILIG